MKMIDIIISDELRNVLLEIKDSKVAELLLRGSHSENTLVENPVNYISISKKDLTKISYLPKERYDGLTIDECWLTTKRIMAKPGGFISKVFIDISEKEVEKFSTLFRNEVTKPKLDFKVVSGDDIKKYYHYTSYSERGGGSLNASCMKYDNCQDFLQLYTSNPEICKMVVLYDNEYQNRILGRALLWEFNGNKIMDRIYTINDEDYQFYFKQWATKNGFLFKSEQNWFNVKSFERLGEKKQKLELVLKLSNVENLQYTPYMDTFKFLDYDGNLHNVQPKNKDYWTLTTTDGRKHAYDYLVTDIIDDVLRYRHDACYLRYLKGWTSHNNCKYSSILDTYILNDDCVYNNDLRDYIFNEENNSHNDEEIIDAQLEYIKSREEKVVRRRRSVDGDRFDNGHDIQSLLNRFGVFTSSVRLTQETTESQNDVTEQEAEQTGETIPTESEPVGAIGFSSIHQPTETIEEPSESRTSYTQESMQHSGRYIDSASYLRYGDLDDRYLEHLRRNALAPIRAGSSVSPHDGEMVRYIEDYIQHNYRNPGYREIDSPYVRYISENVSYKYTIGQMASLREIVEYIDYSLTPFRVEQVEPLRF